MLTTSGYFSWISSETDRAKACESLLEFYEEFRLRGFDYELGTIYTILASLSLEKNDKSQYLKYLNCACDCLNLIQVETKRNDVLESIQRLKKKMYGLVGLSFRITNTPGPPKAKENLNNENSLHFLRTVAIEIANVSGRMK
jgi:hypothetical protein